MSRRKQKRKPGDCEICGFRGCPACSEEELFRQMGITSCEVLEDDQLFPALADEIKTLQAHCHNLRIYTATNAPVFSKQLNKIAMLFEEICERKIKSL